MTEADNANAAVLSRVYWEQQAVVDMVWEVLVATVPEMESAVRDQLADELEPDALLGFSAQTDCIRELVNQTAK